MRAVTTSKKASTQHKTTAAPAASKKTAAARGTQGKAKHKPSTHTAQKGQKTTVHSTHAARPAPAKWHPGQTAPTADRYKEIHEALAKKGYLHGEADGVWNQDSADALRHFQQDQNLQASGKLDSLSIIALGLGPKY